MNHEYYMKLALEQARIASERGEVPVGAVVVSNGMILAKAHNQVEQLQDVTAHAEIIAITAAENHVGNKYLKDCVLYVTLEPCVMCIGASYWSQLKEIHYAASDEKRGFSTLSPEAVHPKTQLFSGMFEAESRALLQAFFGKMREL